MKRPTYYAIVTQKELNKIKQPFAAFSDDELLDLYRTPKDILLNKYILDKNFNPKFLLTLEPRDRLKKWKGGITCRAIYVNDCENILSYLRSHSLELPVDKNFVVITKEDEQYYTNHPLLFLYAPYDGFHLEYSSIAGGGDLIIQSDRARLFIKSPFNTLLTENNDSTIVIDSVCNGGKLSGKRNDVIVKNGANKLTLHQTNSDITIEGVNQEIDIIGHNNIIRLYGAKSCFQVHGNNNQITNGNTLENKYQISGENNSLIFAAFGQKDKIRNPSLCMSPKRFYWIDDTFSFHVVR